MEGKQYIYYALGQIAYAVAMADGEVQANERRKLQEIVSEGIKHHEMDYDVTEIIFGVLARESMDMDTVYGWAIKDLEKHKFYLTDEIKKDFISIIEQIALAFDSVKEEEQNIVDRFRADIMAI